MQNFTIGIDLKQVLRGIFTRKEWNFYHGINMAGRVDNVTDLPCIVIFIFNALNVYRGVICFVCIYKLYQLY